MITIDYIGRGGVTKSPKSDYVILEQPLKGMVHLTQDMASDDDFWSSE